MAACAAAVAAVTAGCSPKEAPAPAPKAPTKVGVVTLATQSQQLDASLPGRTRAFMTAEVRPQVSGIVQKRLFTEGATVKAGQPLYQIDSASLRATLASAEAALAKVRASQRTLQATAARNAELVKIDAISRQANEESQAAVAQSAADVAAAQAALENARINLRYSSIQAPISGQTSLSTVTPGALVTANQAEALTTIVQLDPMYVDFTQSSTELLQLKRDIQEGRFQKLERDAMTVQLRLEDGRAYPHPGKLQFAGVIVNPSTGVVTLRAVVPNPEGVLMPGMYVQAALPTGIAPEALLVPQQAVTRDIAGKASVLVIDAESKAQRRPIEIDRAVGSRWMVTSGLAAGDKVVVDGFQRVKAGDRVDPQEVDLRAKARVAEAATAQANGAPSAGAPGAAAPGAAAPANAPAAQR
ncbi:efflux RND transporter periplasmic adaptor subunit [Comamonas endophytica]|uniref:Efflux RND transporter periplasmic adaptor subunit n=1 Tax=Comamonas endophytica TaxID=2949090 RepID=A0ABY6GE67_9BURK|nr:MULTISPECIES: efflux RND transporter periplasmic adaptor subunit [unclassified Acidovorax]MCD2511722.1 efflux RND transporter periplasmic adaptor subunit [Acidovorax sp. D4N7]UYG53345.1 efflux RND transporter periplasmic adaptor subunit [Acidovorax sp. 5MLIR]